MPEETENVGSEPVYTLNAKSCKKVRVVAARIAEVFKDLDGQRRIQKSDFFNDKKRKSILNMADGADVLRKDLEKLDNKNDASWSEFKDKLVTAHEKLGFEWTKPVGKGGPLELSSMTFPPACGEELAKGLHKSNVESGDILVVLRSEFPNVTRLFGGLSTVDIKPLRTTFKSTTVGKTKAYKFTRGQGSVKFHLCGTKYLFPGGKKAEKDLGKIIGPKIKAMLSLECLNHVQSTRKYGQYQNLDFEGFKINRGLDEDLFNHFSFELKANNTIGAVSQAISQAVNYQPFSNFTYIIIPNFSAESFFDEDRYFDLVRMCKENGLGVISVECTEKEVEDIVEVLEAPFSEASNHENLLDLIKGSNWEKCLVCRRVAHQSDDRIGCGWKVTVDSDEVCMKMMMEDEQVSRHRQRNQSEGIEG